MAQPISEIAATKPITPLVSSIVERTPVMAAFSVDVSKPNRNPAMAAPAAIKVGYRVLLGGAAIVPPGLPGRLLSVDAPRARWSPL